MLGSLYAASTGIMQSLGQGATTSNPFTPGSLVGGSLMLPVTLLYEAGKALGIPAEWLLPPP